MSAWFQRITPQLAAAVPISSVVVVLGGGYASTGVVVKHHTSELVTRKQLEESREETRRQLEETRKQLDIVVAKLDAAAAAVPLPSVRVNAMQDTQSALLAAALAGMGARQGGDSRR